MKRNQLLSGKYIWLSHPLSEDTPLYGGMKDITILKSSSIQNGETVNSLSFSFPNHSGTHVDVPHHFFDYGKILTDYSPSFWIFSEPQLIDVPSADGYLVTPDDILNELRDKTDLLLIRTGYEKYRNEARYWQKNPGLSRELAQQIRTNFPQIRAIGLDAISITSRLHRREGREVHREFLGSHYESEPIVLIEDMSLLNYTDSISQVIISPLMIENADGAPCTITAI